MNELRAAVDLPPLEETIEQQRKAMQLSSEPKPADIRRRRAEMDAWARSVGWRKP